jgi:hypothetical protein
MHVLYALTIFFSATQLFIVQLLIGKFLLPSFGGAPALWNVTLVFFQGALLAGYWYAHRLIQRHGTRGSFIVHAVVLIAMVLLVKGTYSAPELSAESTPVASLLGWLLLNLAVPVVGLASTAPLVQHWYGLAFPKLSPYKLYAASNLGSFGALLVYPLVLEPRFAMSDSLKQWQIGIWITCGLICASGIWTFLKKQDSSNAELLAVNAGSECTFKQKAMWGFCSAASTGLMMSLTLFITTDIAAVPLLWTVPLGLYLLTFVAAFSERHIISLSSMVRWTPLIVIVCCSALLVHFENLFIRLSVLLLLLVVLCSLAHRALAETKPSSESLGVFYLWISIGGLVGGLFQTIIAPVLFNSLAEVPLFMILALAARAFCGTDEQDNDSRVSIRALFPAGIALLGAFVTYRYGLAINLAFLLTYGLPCIAAYASRTRALHFAVSWGLMLLVAWKALPLMDKSNIIAQERNFFGVKSIVDDPTGTYRSFRHGNINHGCQLKDEAKRLQPACYSHIAGPVGDIFAVTQQYKSEQPLSVGVIGLGAGAMACYSRPNDNFTFYELDPKILTLAQDVNYFTLLRDCPGQRQYQIGDGRTLLERDTDKSYDLLFIDAFSSDAIPVHLLTQEAVALYLTRLADDGVVVLQISNLYVDLEPVVASISDSLGLHTAMRDDTVLGADAKKQAHFASRYMVVGKSERLISKLRSERGWQEPSKKRIRPWTDNYSAIVSSFLW